MEYQMNFRAMFLFILFFISSRACLRVMLHPRYQYKLKTVDLSLNLLADFEDQPHLLSN